MANKWALGQFAVGNDTGAAFSFSVDSSLVYGTSGDSFGIEHVCIEELDNDTLLAHVYCTAITGTPDSMVAYIYLPAGASGDDIDRPDITSPSAQYTSDTVDFSGGVGWKTFTFTGVTWPQGKTIWIIIANTHATPASNYPDIQLRGGLDGFLGLTSGSGNPSRSHNCWQNSSGWTADGSAQAGSVGAYVIEYPSGNSYGNPWVVNSAGHASNTNYRGNRITPTEDIAIRGLWMAPDSNMGSVHVVQDSTDHLNLTISTDWNAAQRGGGARFSPITLTGGLAYDLLFKPGANDTMGAFYTMGTGATAGVKNAGGALRLVDGATLDSLAYNDEQYFAMWAEFDDNPEIAAGGGGDPFPSQGIQNLDSGLAA